MARKTVGEVRIGRRFRYPLTGKVAEKLGNGDMGARIRYVGAQRKVEFTVEEWGKKPRRVSYTKPAPALIVSNGTLVEVL